MHKHWLMHTLTLAKICRGFCSPNPAVGAVVVKNGCIIAEGFHLGAGHNHAEVEALKSAGKNAVGADLYISLEPCCHFGRTPPCTDLIKKTGISRVFFGFFDPNPIVSGNGQKILQDAGIECEYIQLPEINNFYRSYDYWFKNKMPFVTAKIAITKDGYIAKANGDPIKITGDQCNNLTHLYRKNTDAILTTAKTIIADNPQLNSRLNSEIIVKPIYILDSNLSLKANLKIYNTAKSITIFHKPDICAKSLNNIQSLGVRCVAINENNKGLDLEEVLSFIGRDGAHDLWVEVGATCFKSLYDNNFLQRVLCYVSDNPLNHKGLSSGINLDSMQDKALNFHISKLAGDTVYDFTYTC